MPRLIVSIDSVVIKEVQLTKARTTLGRRPYNDIVIDNPAVSGEHAVLHLSGNAVEIEDLGSTNGTYVNTKAIQRQTLHDGDVIEVAKYIIRFHHKVEVDHFAKTTHAKPGSLPPPALAPRPSVAVKPAAAAPLPAVIRVLSGSAAGREVALLKVVTIIGKPGVAVASITKRHGGHVLVHVEGDDMPLLNGTPIETDAPLHHGDRITLAGTDMQFQQG
ncbi:MAG TPA: FHA domain-containing protein [Acidovorax sp.]|mgnify:CR=1 FL=1|nr:FHA domain-containing protein [Acidovorax sp.]